MKVRVYNVNFSPMMTISTRTKKANLCIFRGVHYIPKVSESYMWEHLSQTFSLFYNFFEHTLELFFAPYQAYFWRPRHVGWRNQDWVLLAYAVLVSCMAIICQVVSHLKIWILNLFQGLPEVVALLSVLPSWIEDNLLKLNSPSIDVSKFHKSEKKFFSPNFWLIEI